MTFSVPYEITSLGIDTKEIGSIWFVEVVITIAINDINTLKDILVTSDITT